MSFRFSCAVFIYVHIRVCDLQNAIVAKVTSTLNDMIAQSGSASLNLHGAQAIEGTGVFISSEATDVLFSANGAVSIPASFLCNETDLIGFTIYFCEMTSMYTVEYFRSHGRGVTRHGSASIILKCSPVRFTNGVCSVI